MSRLNYDLHHLHYDHNAAADGRPCPTRNVSLRKSIYNKLLNCLLLRSCFMLLAESSFSFAMILVFVSWRRVVSFY